MEDTLFNELMRGLEDAIAYERGDTSRGRTVLVWDPVPEYSAQDVTRIRESLGKTHFSFAIVMGVSARTVQAWEAGRSKLSGPVRHLLYLVEQDPSLAGKLEYQRKTLDPAPPGDSTPNQAGSG